MHACSFAVLLVRCSWSAQPLICSQLVSALRCGRLASYCSYDDACSAHAQVRDNLSEGLRFYASLQEALTALAQHVGDFCLTRRIQRCFTSTPSGPTACVTFCESCVSAADDTAQAVQLHAP